jgi:hypothetical protein
MKPAPIKPLISTSDLDKIDVRVGTILAVEDVVHSEKLARLRVDFGDHARSILVGMKKERPSAKEIEGRQALFVVNLAPRKVAARFPKVSCSISVMPMRSRQCWRSRRGRFRTAPARAEGPVERLLSFAKLPMTSDGEALSEPGAATCSAKSGPTMLT